jgi:sugar phosphate isomerase/epimerase
VPPSIVQRDRRIGTGTPVSDRYHRITFEKDLVTKVGAPVADLVAPGHPLLDATIDLVLEQHRHHLTRGAVFVDESDLGVDPRVMVMLEHEVANAVPRGGDPHSVVSRRFEFVEVPTDGSPRSVAYAPYLDYRAITAAEWESVQGRVDRSWPGAEVEELGLAHAIEVSVPDHVAEVRARTEARLDAIEAAADFGAEVILVPSFGDEALAWKDQERVKRFVSAVREAGPRAADRGITLGLENRLSAEENHRLLDLVAADGVKIYYDNLHNLGHDPAAEIRSLGNEHICQVHVKDNPHQLGEGDIDFAATARALDEIGYKGWLVLETRIDEDPAIHLPKSRRFVRRVFG